MTAKRESDFFLSKVKSDLSESVVVTYEIERTKREFLSEIRC